MPVQLKRCSFALACLLVLTLTLLEPSAPTRAASDKPVMAFYYPWWDQSDWTYDKMSDLPVPRYSAGDDATINRHIQQADDAGIDALICTWFGPDEPRLDGRCKRLQALATASGRDLQIAIIPDHSAWANLKSVDSMVNALAALQRDFMSKPNYLTFQGKPVVVWFRPEDLGNVNAWKQIRDRADPNHQQFWFGGTDQFNYLDVFDSLYYFDITWETAPGRAMASYAGRLKSYNDSHGTSKPFIATAEPGYDDLKFRNGHARDRANGDYYRGTWQTAIDRKAAAVVLTSFNEFFEGTHIEPSEKYGDLYLRLTKEQSDRFHAGVSQPAAPPAQPTTAPSTTDCQTFPETGFQVCGRILEYWNQNGGLPVFGYPIAAQTVQEIEGKAITLQWFERNRLELHPENARPYDILLGRLGADSLAAQGRDWTTFAKADPSAAHYFGQTGHAIAPQFWAYWSSHGLEFDNRRGTSFDESLALVGLPLSEATMETNPTNGQQYLTQHFERARFEYHPENAGTEYTVLLGLLGRELKGIK